MVGYNTETVGMDNRTPLRLQQDHSQTGQRGRRWSQIANFRLLDLIFYCYRSCNYFYSGSLASCYFHYCHLPMKHCYLLFSAFPAGIDFLFEKHYAQWKFTFQPSQRSSWFDKVLSTLARSSSFSITAVDPHWLAEMGPMFFSVKMTNFGQSESWKQQKQDAQQSMLLKEQQQPVEGSEKETRPATSSSSYGRRPASSIGIVAPGLKRPQSSTPRKFCHLGLWSVGINIQVRIIQFFNFIHISSIGPHTILYSDSSLQNHLNNIIDKLFPGD